MGSRAFGKFRLIAELGHGGMADVFLAVQAGPAGLGVQKLTVVKCLRHNLVDQPEFVLMLVEEARIALRLNHPNVVQTHEVGSVDDNYFIAMEYLDGQPFHRIQHRSKREATEGAVPVFTADQQYLVLVDALAGLHYAHELADYDGRPLDLVHRDMNPQNIFVTYDGQVKVVDFGIAKAAGLTSETTQGVVKGKLRYMAPEQAAGRELTRCADVFAVGVMIWEVAVGRRLWKGQEDLQILHALVAGNVPMPRDVNADVPETIDKICRKALATRPEDRYATAEELRRDLEQYLADAGTLVQTRRQLAPMLVELFRDKRAEIRAVIEQQLASDGVAGSDGILTLDDDIGSLSSGLQTRSGAPVAISTARIGSEGRLPFPLPGPRGAPASLDAEATPAVVASNVAGKGWRSLAWPAAVVVAVVSLSLWALPRASSVAPPAPPPVAVPTVPPAPTAAPVVTPAAIESVAAAPNNAPSLPVSRPKSFTPPGPARTPPSPHVNDPPVAATPAPETAPPAPTTSSVKRKYRPDF